MSAQAHHSDLATVAYLVVSHRGDDLLERVVRAVTTHDPDAEVLISHDRRGASAITPTVRKLARHIEFATGGRGDFGQIERILSLMRRVSDEGLADYVTIISGEDYPCGDLIDMRARLADSPDGFLHHFAVFDPDQSDWSQHEGSSRYHYRWRMVRALSPRTSQLMRLPAHAANYLQPWWRFNTVYGGLRVGRRYRRPPHGYAVYGGSAWFSLSLPVVRHILGVVDVDDAYMQWARHSIAVDEVFFQTIVCNAPQFTVAARAHRFIDFDDSQYGHPAYLTVEDVNRVVASDAYFCRKVQSRAFMDAMDHQLAQNEKRALGVAGQEVVDGWG